MPGTTAYDEAAAQIRRASRATSRDDRELIRMAALAASSHNTQPWTFSTSTDAITIQPDLTRRCPVVDPDDAHLFKSLGCAAENMVQAAAAQGIAATVSINATDQSVSVDLSRSTDPGPTPLADAILTRQCTREAYDGRPVTPDDLAALEAAGTLGSARCAHITDAGRLGEVAAFVTRGNLAQLNDPHFREELLSWIRFNPASALKAGDGLAGRTTGQPGVPSWFGFALQRILLKADTQAKVDAERLASSAGVTMFVSPADDVSAWVDAGRAYQRYALQAEALDIRTAFINQPIEVTDLRPEFESWLGLTDERVHLAVRFGHGAKVPYSLRRPIDDVITSAGR